MSLLEDALAIEEAYELSILDYVEFETSIYKLSLEGLIRGHSERNSNFFENRRLLNRAISNFLSSSRAYTDQIEKLDNNYNGLKSKTTAYEFDNTTIYPFVYRLRNYVQHYDVVIHKKRHGSFSLFEDAHGNNPNRPHNSSLELIIDKSRLKDSTVFTNKILEPMPQEISITPLLRQYLGCLSRIHNTVREELGYSEFCNGLRSDKNSEHDYRKVDAILSLVRKIWSTI